MSTTKLEEQNYKLDYLDFLIISILLSIFEMLCIFTL
jgi:hypothetical protein